MIQRQGSIDQKVLTVRQYAVLPCLACTVVRVFTLPYTIRKDVNLIIPKLLFKPSKTKIPAGIIFTWSRTSLCQSLCHLTPHKATLVDNYSL